ncbi:hypothetical protein EYF80_025686 [Liparis tanakae]|uniref:Uncharacterized protein n=1 Tax=Liparis tanakae TaxID=230148 RepID=A0A4Z2HDV9_9TELE|nr:hypothetical protein EYF80_025686 [Liparis tanakae]
MTRERETEAPELLTPVISSEEALSASRGPESVIASSVSGALISPPPWPHLCVRAGEGLVAAVRPHVDLQPLQHVEALPAALGAAPEHSVVPGSPDEQEQASEWYLRWAGQVNVRQQPSNEQRRSCLASGRLLRGGGSRFSPSDDVGRAVGLLEVVEDGRRAGRGPRVGVRVERQRAARRQPAEPREGRRTAPRLVAQDSNQNQNQSRSPVRSSEPHSEPSAGLSRGRQVCLEPESSRTCTSGMDAFCTN